MPGLDVKVSDNGIPARIGALPGQLRKAILQEETQIGAMLLGKMRAKAGGQVVHVRSGKYLASFYSRVRNSPNAVNLTAGSNSPLAHIIEYGAQIPEHIIRPRGRALKFLGTSGEVFASIVHSKGALVGPHSVEHSTFLEERDQIADGLAQTISTVLAAEQKAGS